MNFSQVVRKMEFLISLNSQPSSLNPRPSTLSRNPGQGAHDIRDNPLPGGHTEKGWIPHRVRPFCMAHRNHGKHRKVSPGGERNNSVYRVSEEGKIVRFEIGIIAK